MVLPSSRSLPTSAFATVLTAPSCVRILYGLLQEIQRIDPSLNVTRETVKASVFQFGHRLPTMSLEELADRELADAQERQARQTAYVWRTHIHALGVVSIADITIALGVSQAPFTRGCAIGCGGSRMLPQSCIGAAANTRGNIGVGTGG